MGGFQNSAQNGLAWRLGTVFVAAQFGVEKELCAAVSYRWSSSGSSTLRQHGIIAENVRHHLCRGVKYIEPVVNLTIHAGAMAIALGKMRKEWPEVVWLTANLYQGNMQIRVDHRAGSPASIGFFGLLDSNQTGQQ
jgi:hypothetical protein